MMPSPDEYDDRVCQSGEILSMWRLAIMPTVWCVIATLIQFVFAPFPQGSAALAVLRCVVCLTFVCVYAVYAWLGPDTPLRLIAAMRPEWMVAVDAAKTTRPPWYFWATLGCLALDASVHVLPVLVLRGPALTPWWAGLAAGGIVLAWFTMVDRAIGIARLYSMHQWGARSCTRAEHAIKVIAYALVPSLALVWSTLGLAFSNGSGRAWWAE